MPSFPEISADAPRARRLWLYGLGMLAPAAAFAWRYPLAGNTDRLVDMGQLARYRAPELLAYLAGMGLLFWLYLLGLREARRLPARQALPAVFGVGAALVLLFGSMYPLSAIDLFLYAVRSRLLTAYGANPLSARPVDYAGDPWMRFASREWEATVSPYGPLWSLLAAPTTLLAGDNLALALVGFKLLAGLSLLGGAWLIARFLAEQAPDQQASGALLYLWNPLVLWEGAANGHNDVLMLLPLLLALLAWARRRDGLVIPLLVVAALVKYVGGLLLPLAAAAVWRRAGSRTARARLLLLSGLLSGLACLVAFFPFYDVPAALRSLGSQAGIAATSPVAVLIAGLGGWLPGDLVGRWARLATTAAALGVLAWQARAVWRAPAHLPTAAFEVLYAFVLLAAWNFRSWYLIWPLGLVALLPWRMARWRMLAWTGGAMAAYPFFIWIWPWLRLEFTTAQAIGTAIIFAPTLAVAVAELARRRRGQPSAPGPDACAQGAGPAARRDQA